MKIRALVVEAKDAPFTVQEIELAEPGRGEVLLRIAASGVCHTDAITRAGDLPMPFPCVLGHEGSGTVEKVGPGVTMLASVTASKTGTGPRPPAWSTSNRQSSSMLAFGWP